ncbi:MAG: hypothetical protein K6E91_05660 [Butyrivibrio sp.]|nr:hypothetical protein [Butyrivibrio sp.]
MSGDIKCFISAALILVMLIAFPMGYGARAQESTATTINTNAQANAAQQAKLAVPAELKGAMPALTCFKSDSFGGIKVNYDGKDDFIVKEGENKVALTVTINDEARAKKSLGSLCLIFGTINIENKKGITGVFACKVTGIAPAKYQEYVDKAGNKTLTDKAKEITDPPSGTAKDFLDLAEYIAALEDVFGLVYPAAEPAQKKKETPAAAAATASSSSDSGSSSGGGSSSDDNGGGSGKITQVYNRTIVIYMDGTDLESNEGSGTDGLLDILASDIPVNTKIVVVTGGANTWHMDDYGYYQDYTARTLYPKSGGYSGCSTSEKKKVDETAAEMYALYSTKISGLQVWEIVDNGSYNSLDLVATVSDDYIIDPAILTASIDLATAYAPAANYDLIIWDHGSGVDGFGDDELLTAWVQKNPNKQPPFKNGMTIADLSSAIENTVLVKSGGKFDLIGFDACLMASEEVAYALSKYTNYYVSSEEIVPTNGWNYRGILSALSESPYMSTPLLADAIASSFISSNKDNKSTMSVVDMSKMETLNTALSKFANQLAKEADENYYGILWALGADSHFGDRNGYNSSNLFDLKRLATAFSNGDIFSEDLKKASRGVIEALSSAVINNYNNDTTVDNGGLSIYFPIYAFYSATNAKGETVYNDIAADRLKTYIDMEVNKDYVDMAADMAVRSLAGRLIGEEFWLDDAVSIEDVISKMESRDKWKEIIEVSGMDKNDPEDPLIKDIAKLIQDRITAGDIEISIPEPVIDDGAYLEYDEPVEVTIKGAEPVIVGDWIEVSVTLGDIEASLGNTLMYSHDMESGIDDDGEKYVKFNVDPYDQKWYTLNGQITSMYVTDVKTDGGFYGYIPLLLWDDAAAAAQSGNSQKRDDYMIDQADKGNAYLYLLNVEATNSDSGLSIKPVDFVRYDEGHAQSSVEVAEFADSYVEILGGADELYSMSDTPGITSLGTVYIDEDATINIGVSYVENLASTYYVTDFFGNSYGLTKENLGAERGLDDFYETIPEGTPEDDIVSWAESQILAEIVRYQASVQAKEEAGSTTSTVQSNIAQQLLGGQQTQNAVVMQLLGQQSGTDEGMNMTGSEFKSYASAMGDIASLTQGNASALLQGNAAALLQGNAAGLLQNGSNQELIAQIAAYQAQQTQQTSETAAIQNYLEQLQDQKSQDNAADLIMHYLEAAGY